jgi:hypothetical protein
MKLLKMATLFLIVLMTVSVASAGEHRHHYKNNHRHDRYSWNDDPKKYEENSLDENDKVPSITPSYNSDVTVKKMCRNNICNVGGDGQKLVLKNYASSTNPSYKQLISFLKADKTDELPYTSTFVCSDFAVRLHDNAEKAGIKMGWCASDSSNHAWNIVETTDRGIVYVDCTGFSSGGHLEDRIVNVEEGEPLRERYLFKEGGFTMSGRVERLLVYW